ncbi:MAG: hypothetical protein H7061_01945 [Bdellovibrionaceae bacterium]|nr:hypothetical protein [Bdellovibrio sp.]
MAKLSTIAMFICFLIFQFSPAQDLLAPETLNGVNIAPAIEFYGQRVSRVASPFKVYNWMPMESFGDKESDWAKNYTLKFWQLYGTKNDRDFYGAGLYGAADPVITYHYGGADWRLTEISVPSNLKVLEMDYQPVPPPNVQSILNTFGCPLKLNEFFKYSGQVLPASCHQFVRKIFQDILQVDVIAYYYKTEHFDCVKNQASTRAFLMLRNQWMEPGTIRHFTAKSQHSRADRILFQTLFLRLFSPGAERTVITNSESLQLTQRPLLWADLEGAPVASNVKEWLQQNRFACNNPKPYQ